MKIIARFALLLIVTVTVAACGGETSAGDDPGAVYDKLVKAAASNDYGYLYDRLDTKMRANVDTMISVSFQTRERMPEAERSFWDSVGRKSKRDAFIAIMQSDPQMTASLRGDYKVLAADTMVVLTIQRGAMEPELRYFQVEGGELRVSDPPAPPMPSGPLPGNPHGDMTVPDGGAGVPMPNDSIHGGGKASDSGSPGGGKPSK